jgi:AraC-like DNA-binding protein
LIQAVPRRTKMGDEVIHTAEIVDHAPDRRAGIGFAEDECPDSVYPTPPALGIGTIRAIKVHEDMGFFFVKHGAIEDFVTTSTSWERSFVTIGWVLSVGEARAWTEGRAGKHSIAPRSLLIGSASCVNEFADPPLVPTEIANLVISPLRIEECLEERESRLAYVCERLLYEPKGEPESAFSVFDSKAELAIRQVENCPFRGSLKRIYLEGKALELAALAFADIQRMQERRAAGLGREDAKRALRIREYLDQNVRTPPSLHELARWAGISLAKLKRDYKAAFGHNVYQYVVARRMELARGWIEDDGLSVKETAYLSGYKSRAHFAAAYKRHFGHTPKESIRL